MSDFLKSECPHCGQNIEYPSEGTGQTVPCPTCGKSVMLTIQEPRVGDNPVAQSVKGERIFKAWTDAKSFVKSGHVLIFSHVQHWWLITTDAYREFADVKFAETIPHPPGGAIVELHELLSKKAPEQPSQHYEMYCPARVVQNSPPPHRTVRKPREVKILTPLESLAKWLDWRITENKVCVGCHWLPAGPLGYAFSRNTFLTISLSVQIADMIESRGFCVEPDARFGIGSYEWFQTLALFKPFDSDWMQPSTAYLDAANLLRLCILIANADGRIDTVELDVFRRAIESQIGLSQTDHRRLIILEQLLAQELSTSSDYAIAKIIKSIPADKRLTTVKLLVEVATTENVITEEQRRILERIFKAFEIPSDTLEKLIGQACLRPRYDAVQNISNRPSRKWTLKDWRDGHAGVLIDDYTISHKRWNFTDWKVLNTRWRALHEQLNTQQKQFANSQKEITKATPREIKKLHLEYGKPVRTNLSKLTEETIRAETKTGDTPLHRAAKTGRIHDIPSDLLKAELFMAKNHVGRTPVHFAAKYGHLDKIPLEFLTKESVTVFDKYGETPLHTAAYHKHADQIPENFLTLEFLGIHTKHHTAWTVLYLMAFSGQLKLLPAPIIEKYNSMSRLEKGGLDDDMPK